MSSIAARQRESLEQPRHAMVEHGTVITACLVAQRAGNPTFTDTSRSGNQQVLLAADPVTIDKLGEEGALDAARCPQIYILDDCSLTQSGELQACG